jgi:hypothetical protein
MKNTRKFGGHRLIAKVSTSSAAEPRSAATEHSSSWSRSNRVPRTVLRCLRGIASIVTTLLSFFNNAKAAAGVVHEFAAMCAVVHGRETIIGIPFEGAGSVGSLVAVWIEAGAPRRAMPPCRIAASVVYSNSCGVISRFSCSSRESAISIHRQART